jgi:eukaryotic-like serine/threonine-protein kinase
VGVVAVTEGQRLRKYAVGGGAPATLTSFPDSQPSGASWASNDVIYFVSSTPGGIVRLPGQGGDPVEVCAIDFAHGERTHRTPHALPGGRAVLFAVATSESESYDDASIAVFSTDTGQRKVLVEGGLYPRYSPSGHVVYGRNGTLFALPFDAHGLEVTGQPFAVQVGVMMSRNTGVANFDISASGELLYVPGKADGGARTLHWVDRSGDAEKLPLPPRSYLHPRIAPDGRRLAIEVEGSSHDVFVYDFASAVLTNFTADGISHWPIWSPDGRRIGYRSGPMGRFRLFQMPSDRSGPAERVDTRTTSASAGSYDPTGMSSSCGAPGLSSSNYDVTPDGQRFLMIQDEDVATTSSGNMVLVLGFAEDLSRRMARPPSHFTWHLAPAGLTRLVVPPPGHIGTPATPGPSTRRRQRRSRLA